MAKTFDFRISIPNKICLEQKASIVSLPTIQGVVGILPEHAPIIGSLSPGFIRYKDENGTAHIGLVNYGMYYFKNNRLVILSDFYEASCHGVNESAIATIQKRIAEETAKVELSSKAVSALNSYMKLVSTKAKDTNKRK